MDGVSGICRYFRHSTSSLPILQLPICSIPVGTWAPKIGESNRQPLAMLRPSASLRSALNLLVQGRILACITCREKGKGGGGGRDFLQHTHLHIIMNVRTEDFHLHVCIVYVNCLYELLKF